MATKYDWSCRICHQLLTYNSAARTSPGKVASASRAKSSAQTDTANSRTYSAGSRRRARRVQNFRSEMPPVLRRSSTSRDVMRYPLTAKKTSTPRKPPGSQAAPAW